MARIIRKQSLWSKITSYPLDLLLELNEQRESVDWDSYSLSIAIPSGFLLTIVYFFLRLWDDYNTVEASNQLKKSYFDYDYDILKDSRYFSERNSFFGIEKLLSFIKVVITLINVANTALFLLKTRKYTIFNKEKLTGTSENVIKVTKNLEDKNKFWQFFQRLFFRNAYDNDEDEIESYWELTIWSPSKFSTHLFVSFPPFNILFLYLAQSSFVNLIYLSMTSIILYFVIIRGYLPLINDKQMLYQETFDEYQRKFIRPKLSVPTREVAVDATKGPYYHSSSEVQYYSPGLTEKIFRFHDFKGQESVEKFDHGEFTPLKKNAFTHSAVNTLRKQALVTPKQTRYSSYQPSPLARKPMKF